MTTRNLIILTSCFCSFFTFSQGVIRDSKATERIRQNYRVQKTRSLNMPSNYSLEKYTPYVFNQGKSDMCAAYSLALARTMVYARNNNLTNKSKISAEAYSPYYIYSKYKYVMGQDFEGGLTLYFNKLNDFGYAKMKEVEYPHYYPFTEKQLWDFSVPSYLNLNHNYVKSEKFDEINVIYVDDSSFSGRSEMINMIKSEIVKEKPIIFGMNLHSTFTNEQLHTDFWSDTIITWCKYIRNNGRRYCGKYNSNPSGMCQKHAPDSWAAGHAMTLIGYDDNRYGGSFLIQNSWGKEVYDNGKIWIPYHVFVKHAFDIQSLNKKPKTEFEKIETNHDFSYASNEINADVKDFSNSIDLNWVLFASMATEVNADLVNSEGAIMLPNNLKVHGTLTNNLLEGEGEINLNNRYSYKGQFKGGTFHGTGVLVKYDKWGDVLSIRKGLFENGVFLNGTVKEVISSKNPEDLRNGCTYTGIFRDGNYNGEGILTDNFCEFSIDGIFLNGFPINGIISAANCYYEGDYQYEGEIDPETFLPNGKGVEMIDGNKSEGVFYNGVLIK